MKDATSLPAAGRFGPINNGIKQFDTDCDGSESSFDQCPSNWNTTRKCYEDAAVGLCCQSGGLCDGGTSSHKTGLLFVDIRVIHYSYSFVIEDIGKNIFKLNRK